MGERLQFEARRLAGEPMAELSNANRSAGRIAMGIVQFVGRSIWRGSRLHSIFAPTLVPP